MLSPPRLLRLVVPACLAWAAFTTAVLAKDFAPDSPILTLVQSGEEAKAIAMLKAQPDLATHAGRQGIPPICAAAGRGLAQVVGALISAGIDPKGIDLRSGQNALHYAAANGSVKIAASLVKAGVPINHCDHLGNTPLHYAEGSKIALLLINSGADVHMKNSRGVPAWYQVAFRGSDHLDSVLKAKGIDLKTGSDFGTLMHLAAVAGDAKRVRLLAGHGLEVEQESPDGYLPLWAAIQSGKRDAVAALIRLGASARSKDRFGRGALHIFPRQRDIIEALVTAGASVSGSDKHGRGLHPLHVAAVTDRTGWQLTLYCKQGAALDPKDIHGNTPLHWAAYNGNTPALKQYVQLGGKVSPKNNAGLTPLALASLIGPEDAVTFLRSKGAKLVDMEQAVLELYAAVTERNVEKCRKLLSEHRKLPHLRIDCGGPPFYFSSPLHLSSHLGSERIVSILLKSGAPMNSKTYGGGWTPLHLACGEGNLATARLLVKNGAGLDTPTSPAARDSHPMAQTALHIAAKNGKLGVVQMLLAKKASIEKRDSLNRTALHLAASSHNHGIAAEIVLRGGRLDQKDARGSSPSDLFQRPVKRDVQFTPLIHWSLIQATETKDDGQKKWRACFAKCVTTKTEVSARDWYGNTALHIAASRNQVWAVQSLLAAGADADAANNCGDTPLHVAARNGHQDIVRALMAKKANQGIQNCYGKSALAVAQAELEKDDSASKLRLQNTVDLLKTATRI